MGLVFSEFWSLFSKQEAKVVMMGLDAAGKTTVLYRLRLGSVLATMPTIGFNVETLEYNNVKFTVWDVGGQNKIRRSWRHFCTDVHGAIFVVDSSDCDRLDEACEELAHVINEKEMQETPLLVIANKQDLPTAMPIADISDKLGLHRLGARPWFIQSACATAGDGLLEGFDWLSKSLDTKKL
mmetsp:Transcript_56797/g.109674  ORF Transcript_56797/g.109674 Transcript_56797/m.109674 type:complete len:182 (+) Transcript_56797:90-635(+)|eukprot:CAMPEP_0172724772 /NCGR_PEP_ID=MMETSP1074-20121228/86831_1 /TAXON_ID=2916 /ORGANISM="Ceratium fusus, Strain PA161109" /LENGTH=181 /DNA_ID=CAMNT_0013551343 /DNA_START=79 /DNA_END=624 /DNA_ORIENTATION=+